jgi:hypothetical protein
MHAIATSFIIPCVLEVEQFSVRPNKELGLAALLSVQPLA